jgi:hypothetical protein
VPLKAILMKNYFPKPYVYLQTKVEEISGQSIGIKQDLLCGVRLWKKINFPELKMVK